jgi:hypothetical protein
MNKSAQTTLLKELVYLVIGVIALFILIFVIAPKLIASIMNTPDKESINNFERLAIELDAALYSVKQPDFDILSYSKSIPVNINKNVGVKFYNPDREDIPRSCERRDSLCICIAYVKTFEENKNPFRCKSLENGKGIGFDDTDVDSDEAGLIVTNGISAYVISFLDYYTIKIDVHTSENEEARKITSDSAYLSIQDFCDGDYDCINFKAFGDQSSKSPKGSPFGRSIRITSGYITEGYAKFIKDETSLSVPIKHYAIDLVPSESYYGSRFDLNNQRDKPVFFALCDGNAIGSTAKSGANYITLNCEDGNIITYYHNMNNFVREKIAVKYGQPLGIMGNTGNSAGAHIHFSISDKDGAKNPLNFMQKSDISISSYTLSAYDKEILCQIDKCSLTDKNPNPKADCITGCYPPIADCKYVCKAK